jgi:hypothetical protein
MLPLVLAAAVSATPAASSGGTPVASSADMPANLDAAPKIRNGIVLGLSLGGGVGQGSGYPNNSQEIGDPQYYASSRVMPGTGFTFLVLGALTDYLNVGFWLGTSSFRSTDERVNAFGVGLRVETFPLIVWVPQLQGLGAFTEFGLGSARLTTAPGAQVEAQGTQSFIGVGAFYEWPFGHFLGGHFAIGPSLEYDTAFSRPFDENGLVASARMVFYGGN